MESFLHFIWQNRLYQKLIPTRSIEGAEIEVLDVGVLNHNAGADFLNAKVRIDGLLWVGAVEIHRSAHEWYEHRHEEDSNYSNVILHVVEDDDCLVNRANGEELPCCVMQISKELRQELKNFFLTKDELRCADYLSQDKLQLNHQNIFKSLEKERLDKKLSLVRELYQATSGDWAKTLYLLLMRYFGFGINNEEMLSLARSIDLKLLLKLSSLEQEALLLGQAGLISQVKDELYAQSLEDSYNYLIYKYQLSTLAEGFAFKRLRTRPKSFPLVRIRQMIALLNQLNLGADAFEDCQTTSELVNLLRYGTAKLSKEKVSKTKSSLSKQAAEMLVINVVIPFIIFSKEELHRPTLNNKLNWQALPPENNRITRLFSTYNFPNQVAADSQSILHLYKEYCEKKKCFFCPYGRVALSRKGG